jgi:hypothetical protein
MQNSTKIVILSIVALVGLILAITLDSVWVSAGSIVVLAITAIGLSLAASSGGSNLLEQLENFEFLHELKSV